MKSSWVLSYPLSAQPRLWSDWVFTGRTGIVLVCHGMAHLSWRRTQSGLHTYISLQGSLNFGYSNIRSRYRITRMLIRLRSEKNHLNKWHPSQLLINKISCLLHKETLMLPSKSHYNLTGNYQMFVRGNNACVGSLSVWLTIKINIGTHADYCYNYPKIWTRWV